MPDTPEPADKVNLIKAINSLVVRVMQEYTGRGPNRARVTIVQDVITVVMQDILSKGEQVLVEGGELEAVLTIRRTFHRAMRQTLIDGVEELTGRKVVAFVSGHQAEPDYAAKVFVLGEPLDPAEG